MISSNSRLVDFQNKIHLLELVRFITPTYKHRWVFGFWNRIRWFFSANISTKAPKVQKWVLLRVEEVTYIAAQHVPDEEGSGTEQGLIRSPQEVGQGGHLSIQWTWLKWFFLKMHLLQKSKWIYPKTWSLGYISQYFRGWGGGLLLRSVCQLPHFCRTVNKCSTTDIHHINAAW